VPGQGGLLDLLARRPGGGFAPVAALRTAPDGLVAAPLTLRTTTEYQLRTAPGGPATATSAVVRVQVQPTLTAALAPAVVPVGRPAVLNGTLAPAYLGARLQVQRRNATGWRAVAVVGTDRAGRYRWTATPGTTGRLVLRVVLPAAAVHLGAATPARALVRSRACSASATAGRRWSRCSSGSPRCAWTSARSTARSARTCCTP
jgi:hypothetical protein